LPGNRKGFKNRDLEVADSVVDRKRDSNESKTIPNHSRIDTPELPPDLADIVVAWPQLPKHIKAAIKALIQTHSMEGSTNGED
jgi:hypothetical protein